MRNRLLAVVGALILATALPAVPTVAQSGPNHPTPQALALNPATTALIVLDLNERCADPTQICSELVPRVRPLIDKARSANAFVLYTVSEGEIALGRGDPWHGFDARPDEPVMYIGVGFDKFRESDLNDVLPAPGSATV